MRQYQHERCSKSNACHGDQLWGCRTAWKNAALCVFALMKTQASAAQPGGQQGLRNMGKRVVRCTPTVGQFSSVATATATATATETRRGGDGDAARRQTWLMRRASRSSAPLAASEQ
eukprot:4023883-Pleurochrysis_carterae.AAC.3